MSDLEKIAFNDLVRHLNLAFQNLQEKEQGHQEHLRIFTLGHLQRAFRTIDALVDHQKQMPNE